MRKNIEEKVLWMFDCMLCPIGYCMPRHGTRCLSQLPDHLARGAALRALATTPQAHPLPKNAAKMLPVRLHLPVPTPEVGEVGLI